MVHAKRAYVSTDALPCEKGSNILVGMNVTMTSAFPEPGDMTRLSDLLSKPKTNFIHIVDPK